MMRELPYTASSQDVLNMNTAERRDALGCSSLMPDVMRFPKAWEISRAEGNREVGGVYNPIHPDIYCLAILSSLIHP